MYLSTPIITICRATKSKAAERTVNEQNVGRTCKFLFHILSPGEWVFFKMQMKGRELPTIAPNLGAAMITADLVPRTKAVFDIGYFLSLHCQKHLVPHIFLTLHSGINIFISLHCLNVTTWVMCQHGMELDQQLPSLMTANTYL